MQNMQKHSKKLRAGFFIAFWIAFAADIMYNNVDYV